MQWWINLEERSNFLHGFPPFQKPGRSERVAGKVGNRDAHSARIVPQRVDSGDGRRAFRLRMCFRRQGCLRRRWPSAIGSLLVEIELNRLAEFFHQPMRCRDVPLLAPGVSLRFSTLY